MKKTPLTILWMLLITISVLIATVSCQSSSGWQSTSTKSFPAKRHEADLVTVNAQIFLLGGRDNKPVEQFNAVSQQWQKLPAEPIDMHHFQAVPLEANIYIVGAFEGEWPQETPLSHVIKFDPNSQQFEQLHAIPADRRRGAAAAVAYQGKIYVLGGLTNGHMNGYQPWFDQYDPHTGQWSQLPDAPRARDHFQAVIVGHKLYAIGGRTTSHATGEDVALTIAEVDVFDFETRTWSTLPSSLNIPTQRAGAMAVQYGNSIIVAGGESGTQEAAHNEVEQLDLTSGEWRSLPNLIQGRHGSGMVVVNQTLITASGAGKRGGEPELSTTEQLHLGPPPAFTDAHQQLTHIPQWHTLNLKFTGPDSAESATVNPFTDYRLWVRFRHGEREKIVRGFYAADGNAANTGADAGNVWQVRFSPDEKGLWEYEAFLYHGKNVALAPDFETGKAIPLEHRQGKFMVTASTADAPSFKKLGTLYTEGGYYKTADAQSHWLKGGTNSPENLLAFEDFDGTYRVRAQVRDGEASSGDTIHHFNSHQQDWETGDPVWKNNKGKNLIGLVNYLADVGLNSAYFLTLNIDGDGKDVWPYIDHQTFDRFDVSKLEQWNIVFDHMQSHGIALHMVIQETENERLLDGGDTGPMRQLYFQELIARFGHHPGLIWNLGEENGPAEFSPDAQTDQQRIDMANYLKEADPYQHPIILHTHSTPQSKDEILTPLLGLPSLDGLSFQVNIREQVNAEVRKWLQLSSQHGQKWVITMDEIGEWMHGAKNDFEDPTHDTLRRHALWGSLLAGGAGVEWYFGAHHKHNDLTAEDLRSRHNLWLQTKIAVDFFTQHTEFWKMRSAQDLVSNPDAYAFAAEGNVYVVYLPAGIQSQISLAETSDVYKLHWFNPLKGGTLIESETELSPGTVTIPQPPSHQDWVGLIRANE